MCLGGGREMGKDKEKGKHIRIMATSKVQIVCNSVLTLHHGVDAPVNLLMYFSEKSSDALTQL